MRAGEIANNPDAVGIKIVFGGLGAHECSGGFHVVNRGRKDAGLAQAVIDGENRVAGTVRNKPQ